MPVNSKLCAGSVSTSTPRSIALPFKRERQVAAVLADQTERERDHHRLFGRLAGRRRRLCLAVERVSLARRRRSVSPTVTSGVPAWLYQRMNCGHVAPADVGEALDELLDGCGLAVVAL